MQTILNLEEGRWDLDGVLADQRTVGLLVVSGLLVRDVLIGEVASSELLGPGDLAVQHSGSDAQLPVRVRWSAANKTRLAVLDLSVMTRAANWDRVAGGLLRRASEQMRRGSLHLAIAHLPRVADRVLALMWHLAERWGRVGAAGMIIPLELTHEAIGRLVGARRPTVSLALKELAAEGALTRRSDGTWLLASDSIERLPVAPSDGAPAIAVPSVTAEPSLPADTALAPVMRMPALDVDVAALAERLARVRAEHRLSLERTAAVLERCRSTHERVRSRRVADPAP